MDIHSQLVKKLKDGSYNAFNQLYEIYADLLYGFVLDLTKSPSEAKDILQETFLRIWINRENISTDYPFKAYLYKIARNLILNSFRKQMNSIAFENYISSEEYQKNADNNTEREIYFDEFYKNLEQAKSHLPDRQIQIFELSREQGMSISEIAQNLNISEQTVKNQLTLALKTLREKLSKYSLFLWIFF
ncbi:MAG: RNA polymerase sigma-70 factor [Dysgonomonas sp.]|nr:RNA polymerase sigma-70 factor [Dysgonomonas sp.]